MVKKTSEGQLTMDMDRNLQTANRKL